MWLKGSIWVPGKLNRKAFKSNPSKTWSEGGLSLVTTLETAQIKGASLNSPVTSPSWLLLTEKSRISKDIIDMQSKVESQVLESTWEERFQFIPNQTARRISLPTSLNSVLHALKFLSVNILWVQPSRKGRPNENSLLRAMVRRWVNYPFSILCLYCQAKRGEKKSING